MRELKKKMMKSNNCSARSCNYCVLVVDHAPRQVVVFGNFSAQIGK